MPYIITTYLPGGCLDPVGAGQEPDACHAVATLDEARSFATTIYDERRGTDEDDAAMGIGPDDPIRGEWLDNFDAIQELPEAGGTIGPLPDDTVIKVERVNWNRLADLASYDPLSGATGSRLAQAILDAYNKEHA